MKLKKDYRKIGYFVVIVLIFIEFGMLVATLATETDKLSSESLFFSIVSLVFALTSSLWDAIRQDMDVRDNKMVNDMYQSKPYLYIEQKMGRPYSFVIKNIGKGPLFDLRINSTKSEFNKLFDFIPKDGFYFPLNLDKINEYSFDFDYGLKNTTKNFTDNCRICFNYENEFGDKFEQFVRIQVDSGRVIAMSEKPKLKAFHDNFYFLDANDYIDK